MTYTAPTTDLTNKITAKAASTGDAVTIKAGGKVIKNGTAITWSDGENVVTVEVKNRRGDKNTYTVTVTKS